MDSTENQASKAFICDKCRTFFASNFCLKRHKKKCCYFELNATIHKCLEGCDISFRRCDQLKDHLKLNHNFLFEEYQMEFASQEEFNIWLKEEEQTQNVRFIIATCVKRLKDGTKKYTLKCFRSGRKKMIPEERRKRALKKQGSSKSNLSCTSQITVLKKPSTNKCVIHYTTTHYGHGEDLQHLREPRRNKISRSLLMDDKKKNSDHQSIRDSIVSRRDISSLNILEGCRDPDDATSVDCWVKECEYLNNNPIRFYKKEGEEIDHFKKNDFCLVYIDSNQLENYTAGSNILCVDATHGWNSYKFKLTTVLGLDEFGNGFPIAFMVANRRDTFIYELFFTYLKESINSEIFVNDVFMSDITNVYYNAWESVVGVPQNHLYCSWLLDKAWEQNSSKIPNVEKRKWVYKTLKDLEMCSDQNIFEQEFKLFLGKLHQDEETRNMYAYLITNYTSTSMKWAHCYRTSFGINMILHLENMHKDIRHIYLEGRKIKRLDITINGLIRYIHDKTLARIIINDKDQNNKHLLLINEKHRSAAAREAHISQLAENTFEKCDNNQSHIVKKLQENVCCALACTYCNVCIHCFECSCVDYTISVTICKHIHSVNMLSNCDTQETWSTDSSEEVDNLVSSVSSKINHNSTVTEELRCKVRTELTQLYNNTNGYSTEALTHLHGLLKTFSSLNYSVNKNIELKKVSVTKHSAKKIVNKLNKTDDIIRVTLHDHSYV